MGSGALCKTAENFLKWEVRPDTEQLCFICKKERPQTTNSSLVVQVSTTLPDFDNLGCTGIGWVDYKSFCYLFLQEKVNWKGALQYCRKHGGDLASITNKEENDFIYSQLPKDYCFNVWPNDTECNVWAESGECDKNPTWMATHCHLACKYCYHDCRDKYISEKCMEWARVGECDANPKWMHSNCAQSCGICYGAPTRGFWIGMTKRSHSQMYSWTDLSKPSFTLWGKREPSFFASSQSACVAIFLQTGKWNDGFCTDLLSGFVCKKVKSSVSSTSLSPFRTGCPEENSFGYEHFCYTYVQQKSTWNNAESSCASKGGHLLAITDRFIQAFVSSELVILGEDHWIGLRDKADSPASWASGEALIYTHFSKTMSDITLQTNCFALASSKPVGIWKPNKCDAELPYICQTLREGFTTNVKMTTQTTAPVSCPEPWMPFNTSCYMASEDGHTESWLKAEQRCSRLRGDLASVHSQDEANFLVSLFRDHEDDVHSIWVGINDMNFENFFVWNDGTSITFENWADNEPNNVNGEEHCGEMVLSSTEWNDNLCYLSRHYVCKALRGFAITEKPESVSSKPYGLCGHDWIEFKKYCYFNGKDDHKSWHEARQYCIEKGAELASIHNEDEHYFLVTHVSKNSQSSWLGLNDLNLDGSFKWSDGKSANYFVWGEGEPNDSQGGEKCVVMELRNGRWNDLNCNRERSFICKRPAVDIMTTISKTTVTDAGGCYPGYTQFNNLCYYISEGRRMQWGEAKEECERFGRGSRLASIHSRYEQAYLTSRLFNRSGFYWIGLNDLDKDSSYDWIDNWPLTYTNWDKNAPRQSSAYQYACVAMVNTEYTHPGVWNNFQCYLKNEFVCISPKSTNLPTVSPNPSPEDESCISGYQLYEGCCYKLISQKQTWTQARETCIKDNAHLASIENYYEQAFIELLTADMTEHTWIGCSKEADGSISWTDGKAVSLMLLEVQSTTGSASCGTVKENVWTMKDCQLMLRSVCKMPIKGIETSPKATPTVLTANRSFRYTCNKIYYSYNDSCYLLVTKDVTDFQQAENNCRDVNMTLVSIRSKDENDYIQKILGERVRNEVIQSVWIGLKKVQWKAGDSEHSYFLWTDESPVTFIDRTNSDGSADNHNIQFGYMEYRHHWVLGRSSKKLGYICKGIPDITEWLTTTSSQQSSLSPTELNIHSSTRWPPFPFTNIETPKLPPFHQSLRNDLPESHQDGLSAGQVVGIVIGITGFLLIVAVILFVIWKNRLAPSLYKLDTSLGFDNALFHKTNEAVTLSE